MTSVEVSKLLDVLEVSPFRLKAQGSLNDELTLYEHLDPNLLPFSKLSLHTVLLSYEMVR